MSIVPARISEAVIGQVKKLCQEHPESSGRGIVRLYRRLYDSEEPSSRKIQQIVAETRRGFPEEPFLITEWRPWLDRETPEQRANLLRIDAVCQAVMERRLWKHEARWGVYLAATLASLSPYDQFCFTHLYAERQRVAYYGKQLEIHTEDLDSMLAYRPWIPENNPIWLATRGVSMDDAAAIYPSLEVPGLNIMPPKHDHVWQFALEPPLIIRFETQRDWRMVVEFWRQPNSIFPWPVVIN